MTKKGKIEITNEMVEKDLLEMRKTEGETESVNKEELPENGSIDKANTEQKKDIFRTWLVITKHWKKSLVKL